MRKRVKWVDFVRGMGIIAVVVCHQQNILHVSEIIQLLTLYSVTSLVFCMGVTKGFSLKKFDKINEPKDVMMVALLSLVPTLMTYFVASITFDIIINHVSDKVLLLENLINQSACPPFYYIDIYVKLTIVSPIIWGIINRIQTVKPKSICYFLLLLSTWIIGYLSIGFFDVIGQSYLFVYTCGMIISVEGMPSLNGKMVTVSMILLCIGMFLVTKFYLARVAGDYAYRGYIDVIDYKLQMNPPNLSVICYSVGCILLFYILVEAFGNLKIVKKFFSCIQIIGKYSLDIFCGIFLFNMN